MWNFNIQNNHVTEVHELDAVVAERDTTRIEDKIEQCLDLATEFHKIWHLRILFILLAES